MNSIVGIAGTGSKNIVATDVFVPAHRFVSYSELAEGSAPGRPRERPFDRGLVSETGIQVSPHLDDDDMELTSYLANVEMLLSGTTCSLNHLRLASTEETLEKLSRPAIELGIRQVIGKEVQCRLPGNPRHPRSLPEEIAYLEKFIAQWERRSDGLIRLCLAVECNAVAIEAGVASEEMLISCKKLADRFGLKVSTHHAAGTLSYDKSYLQLLRKTGRTETQALAQLGLLDENFILAHCIHCSDSDIELIAASGASIAYTPTSEAIRAAGIGPAAVMARAGVNVALGSDGPMVDYSVDMVEQMKSCSVLQNVKHRDPNAMPPERSLEFATINAAKALGLESEIGSLERGKRADAVLFDLSNPRCCPASNPISALVCSAKGTDAHTVFVNGKRWSANTGSPVASTSTNCSIGGAAGRRRSSLSVRLKTY